MVCVKESGTEYWKEVIEIVSVSRAVAARAAENDASEGVIF